MKPRDGPIYKLSDWFGRLIRKLAREMRVCKGLHPDKSPHYTEKALDAYHSEHVCNNAGSIVRIAILLVEVRLIAGMLSSFTYVSSDGYSAVCLPAVPTYLRQSV